MRTIPPDSVMCVLMLEFSTTLEPSTIPSSNRSTTESSMVVMVANDGVGCLEPLVKVKLTEASARKSASVVRWSHVRVVLDETRGTIQTTHYLLLLGESWLKLRWQFFCFSRSTLEWDSRSQLCIVHHLPLQQLTGQFWVWRLPHWFLQEKNVYMIAQTPLHIITYRLFKPLFCIQVLL